MPLVIVACATALETDPIPPKLKNPSLQYFVEKHGKDTRGIDAMIAREIRSRGLKANNGPTGTGPTDLDVSGSYCSVDAWLQATTRDMALAASRSE